MKKLLIIITAIIITAISSFFLLINKAGLITNKIQVINDSLYLNGIVILDTLDCNGDELVTNGCFNNSDVKPYAQLNFYGTSVTLSLDKDEWSEATNPTRNLWASDVYCQCLVYSDDSISVTDASGIGKYEIMASLSTTGTKDKQLEIAIAINGVIQTKSIVPLWVVKDGVSQSTFSPTFGVYDLVIGDGITVYMRNITNDDDFTLKSGRFLMKKL